MKKLPVLAVVAGLALLAGCSGSKHEPMDLVQFQPGITVTQAWSVRVPSSDGYLVPGLDGDEVFVAGGRQLSRVDATNGRTEWSTSLDDEIQGGVGTDGYEVSVGLENAQLVVVDGEGKVTWTKKLTADLASPPVIAQGLVIARTMDTRISAFEANSGDLQWTYQRTQPALTVRAPTQMLAKDTLLFVGQPNGHMVLIDIPTGRPVFEFAVAQARGITEVERLIDVVGKPALEEDLLCAAAYQGAVTCVDSRNGQLRWTQKADPIAGPAIDDSNVYVVNANGSVKAFYRESGELRWTNDTMLYRGVSAPVAVPGAVAVGDAEGYVHFLSPRTGEEIGRTRLSGALVTAPVAYGNGAIFQTSSGDIAYLVTR